MEALKSPFLSSIPFSGNTKHNHLPKRNKTSTIFFVVSSTTTTTPDPWSLSDGNESRLNKPKPRSKNPKNPLSDDNARRIIKAKAQYLGQLRKNQGSLAHTPRWIKRTPEQMAQYLEDDRHGHLYGRHVVAAIKKVRSLSGMKKKEYDIREVMGSFVTKLSFREMCVVLKELKGWIQVRDFFSWMKLQLSYRPSVIAYTIVLRAYGQVGKVKLAEKAFLEMLEEGCEPDEVASGTMLCAYARWGHHKAMLSFYSAVQERGVIPSTAVFNFMLSSLQKKSLHKYVLEMWRNMTEDGVDPDHFTYTVVISSLVKEGLLDEAVGTFTEMKGLGYLPEEATYSLLINVNIKNGSFPEALELYDDMRSHGIVPSNFTCASLLTLYYKSGDYPKALSLFSEMAKYRVIADEVIYGLLIRIYGRLGLYEDAQRTFEEIQNLGLLSDEKTYTTMAQVHLNFGRVDKALSLMEEMKSKNILLSRFALIVLLHCHVMMEDLASAETTYQAISKTGAPDLASCNGMLNLYMKLDLMKKAKKLIVQMKEKQVEFDEGLLKTVMRVYCKEGMLTDARKLVEELSTIKQFEHTAFVQTFLFAIGDSRQEKAEDSLFPSERYDSFALELIIILFLVNQNVTEVEKYFKLLLQTSNGSSVASRLITKICKEGDLQKAEYLFQLLIKQGEKPEDSACGSLISLYGKQQKLGNAQKLFKLVANSPAECTNFYSSMVDAYIKCHKVEEAYVLYKEATQEGKDFGPVALSMLVNALTRAGKFQEVEDVVHKSFKVGLKLDTVAYNTFIKAMLEAGKLRFAASIYQQMLSENVTQSLQTYNTMISVYGRGRNVSEAVKMFDIARSKGISLDEKAYTNMICYLGKAGRTKEASFLFKKMQEEGIKPGKVSCKVMMKIYATAGLHNEVEEIILSTRKNGCPPDSSSYLVLTQAYINGLKLPEAENVIIEMQKEGIRPSCSHFNMLLVGYTRAGLAKEAERVYGELVNLGSSPDLECNRTMLRAYLEAGMVNEGISFFESVKTSAELDRFMMSAAVHLYEAAGLEERAAEVLSSMRSSDVPFLKNLEVGSSKNKVERDELGSR